MIAIASGLSSARLATQVADLRNSLSLWRNDASVTDLLRRLETFKEPLRRV